MIDHSSLTFSETELSLLEVLMRRRSATAREAESEIVADEADSSTPIKRELQNLVRKGLARRVWRGTSIVYLPVTD